MSDNYIIKFFLDNNILLTPKEFKGLNTENYKKFLDSKLESSLEDERQRETGTEIKKGKNTQRPVSFNNHIKLRHKTESNNLEISILSGLKKNEKRKIKSTDIVSLYSEKYNIIREMFSGRLSPLSINKLENSKERISIIGIVSQKTENGFTIEDETGSANVIYSNNGNIENDDVIAVTGYMKSNSIFPEDIIFPDIPLKNKHESIESRISFDFSSSDIVEIEGKEAKIVSVSLFSVEKNDKEMKVLLFRKSEKLDAEEAIQLLRKRCINCSDGVLPSFFIIKEIPDIFIISSPGNKKTKTNYKGVTIILADQKENIEIKETDS